MNAAKEYNADETCTSPFIALHCFLVKWTLSKKCTANLQVLSNATSVTMIRKAKNNAFHFPSSLEQAFHSNKLIIW